MSSPRSFWRRHRRICVIAAGAVFLAWLQTSGLTTAGDLTNSWAEERRLAAEIDELKARNAELDQQIQDLEANGFRLEQLAREKMGLAKESEFVVVVPGKE